MRKNLLLILVISPLFTYAQLTPRSVTNEHGRIGFYEFRPQGYNPDSTYSYPLIIFLHGVGERGNGTTELNYIMTSSFSKLLANGATMKFTVNGKEHAFVVLIPQMSKDYNNWQNFYIDAMIDYARQNLKIDKNKIFLTGWSLGGGGAWKYPTASIDSARLIAGIILVAPAPDYTNVGNLVEAKVAVWAHHARDDSSIPVHFTKDAIDAINTCSPDIPALVTYYPSGGHPFVANCAYDTLNHFQYPNMYQWMIGTTRSNTLAANKAPVANAGNDTTILVPSNKTVLNGAGSYDPNDVIISYNWAMISAPRSAKVMLEKPKFPVTNVSGLDPGEYVFRLTVKDEFAVTRSDDVAIRIVLPPKGVNAVPFVDAGPDIVTAAMNYHVTATGKDFDGKIQSYRWRQLSGPVSTTVMGYGKVANVLGMTANGTYAIEISALDDHIPASVGRDTLQITKNAPLPFVVFYWSKRSDDRGRLSKFSFIIFCLLLMLLTAPRSEITSRVKKELQNLKT